MRRIAIPHLLTIISLILGMFLPSCDDELYDPSVENSDNELSLSVSDSVLTLDEHFIEKELRIDWSTGTNYGSDLSIAYSLLIDLEGNDFSSPLLYPLDHEKNRFSYAIDYGTLNQRLLESGLQPDEMYTLQITIRAEVSETGPIQSDLTSVNVSTYKPVSQELYIIGDATPNGWDIANATTMTASNNKRGTFIYEGPLKVGNFKFAVSRDDCLCQDFYTRAAGTADSIVYNEGGSGDDLQWTITEEGFYQVTVDLLNKTISLHTAEIEVVPFPRLWILGDASESGWNIDTPAEFNQDENSPLLFTYEGNFGPGEFKIFAGPLGDFCGEWYRPFINGQSLENGQVNQNNGCDEDAKWRVAENAVGRYRITLNTGDNTIEFEQIHLYIVGDGSPSGWDISSPQALTYDLGDFVFNGELGASNETGEFKFSKYTGDWCDGDWINSANPSQSLNNDQYILTHGCDGPDNKWKLKEGNAGTYEIRINLDQDTMSITRL